MSKFLLFDIDDTLIKGGNTAHLKSFDFAIKEVFGVEVKISDGDWTGMVDDQIVMEVLQKNGVEENVIRSKIGSVNRMMGKYFADNHLSFQSELMPGVVELLDELEGKRVKLGLLTGNIESIAWLKLKDLGIDKYFSFGAFGDMAFVRSQLVPLAAENGGVSISECVLIGDSVRDILCAKEAKVKVISVAAGKFKPLDLVSYEPDLLVDSLMQRKEIFDFLRI